MRTLNKLTLAAITAAFGFPALAQEKPSAPVHVKVIMVIDGDSTITEHDIDESQLPAIEEGLHKADGKNEKVMIMVTKESDIPAEELRQMRVRPFPGTPGEENVIIDRELKPGEKSTGFRYEIEEDNGKQKVVVRTFCPDSAKMMVRKFEGEPGTEFRDEVIMRDEAGKEHKMVMVRTLVKIEEVDKAPAAKKAAKNEKPGLEGNVEFYPNPNNGKFTMDFDSDSKQPVTIVITDMNGREVFKEVVKGEGRISRTIDISKQSKGTYIMTMQQGKKSNTKKIIIE